MDRLKADICQAVMSAVTIRLDHVLSDTPTIVDVKYTQIGPQELNIKVRDAYGRYRYFMLRIAEKQ